MQVAPAVSTQFGHLDKGVADKNWELPKEYADVQLKSSNHERKPEVEVLTEQKPDYNAVELKHSPEKPKEQPTDAEMAAKRPSFASVELRRSIRNMDEVKKIEEGKNTLPDEYGNVQLHSSFHERKPEVEVMAEEKPDYTAVPLKAAPVKPKESSSTPAQRPSYSAASLKTTGQADVLKSGGDVLKTVERNKNEPRPSFSAVQLRKSIVNPDMLKGLDEGSKHALPDEFNSVQLKSSNHVRKAEVEVMEEEKPDYAAVALKKSAAPAEKKPIQPRQASYVEVQLKTTGHADDLKSGGDVHKKVVEAAESRPSYSAVQLKNTGHGDAVKSGQDVKKEVSEDPNKNQLPGEFATVQLKKAAPVVKETPEDNPEAQPEYAAVSLKKSAAPAEKRPIEARTASYVEVQLKSTGHTDDLKSGGDVHKKVMEVAESKPSYSAVQLKNTGHGDAVKSGQDVKKEFAEDLNKNQLPGEFAAVSLKKATPIVKDKMLDHPEAQPEYAAVSLKKSAAPMTKAYEANNPEEKPGYAAVSLKKSAPIVKTDSEIHPEAKPAYAEMKLKAAAPIEKPKIEPRGASHVEVHLKATGQGDAVKSGKDVEAHKTEKNFDLPDVFASVQLKKSVERASEL